MKRSRLEVWLRIDPLSKPKIYKEIYRSAEISGLNYWLEIVFSASIATFGLVLNSPAVIIGAMLISPLMGPIMATGLAIAAGDLYLAIKAITNVIASVSVAVGLSGLIVWLLPFHSPTAEILSRTNPNLLDLGVALFSGLAGSVVVTRGGGGGGVTALPGVAIAVALMPPLCTMGFGLGTEANTRIMGGAGLLFTTNLVAITASAFVIFFLVGMNSPEVRAAAQEDLMLRKPSDNYLRSLSQSAPLKWRVLLLTVLLGVISIPLRTALLQVAGEAVARATAQKVLTRLVPPDSVVLRQVEVGRETVAVHLVSTKSISEQSRKAAEHEIEARSGRKADLSVQTVASMTEVNELMQRFTKATETERPVPPIASLNDIHDDLIRRVHPSIEKVWPPEVPIHDYQVSFDPGNIFLTIRYESRRDLEQSSLDVMQRALQNDFHAPNLILKGERVRDLADKKRHTTRH